MPKSKPKHSQGKKKKVGGPKKKNGPSGRQAGREIRSLLNNRRFPHTYFSTEKGAEGEMVISGKEVIAEVSTSSNFFPVIQQSISPLNNSLFPKLSPIASAFEQFRFRKLRFHYVTGCNATVAGSVMHYVDYDLNDAAAPTAITLLANQTASVGSVALDNSIDYDVSRQMLPKLFTGSNAALNIGSARESFAGFYRLFMDKGPATTQFAGYVYAEYVCCLWTPKPPSPNGGAATTAATSQALVAGSTTRFPLSTINDQVGLPGQVATAPTSTYTGAGGVVGALDYARNVYEAGQWLLEAYGQMTAATSVEQDDEYFDARSTRSLTSLRSLSRNPLQNDFSERKEVQPSTQKVFYRGKCQLLPVGKKDPEPPCCWSGTVQMDLNVPFSHPRCVENPNNRRAPLTSGDVTWTIAWWDVTNGNMHPDFPADVTGMTGVATSSILYSSGTGALNPTLVTPMTVPAGKKYAVNLRCDLGATTGRTLTNLVFGTQANGVLDI